MLQLARVVRQPRSARVDIVVPVHNEQNVLDRSIRHLHGFLATSLPFDWRIVIADNASVDQTPELARALARELPRIAVLTLPEKGRGRALRTAWLEGDADVVCYMDVDLSTDLRALHPLLHSLISGEAEVAIGSRLAGGARVVRGLKREFISRSYNLLLRVCLRARFSDAQCGFKAICAAMRRGSCCQTCVTTAGSSTRSCWSWLSALGCGSGRCRCNGPTTLTHASSFVPTALGDLRGVARLLWQTRRRRAQAGAIEAGAEGSAPSSSSRSYTRQRLTIEPPSASSARFIDLLLSRIQPASPVLMFVRSATSKCSM